MKKVHATIIAQRAMVLMVTVLSVVAIVVSGIVIFAPAGATPVRAPIIIRTYEELRNIGNEAFRNPDCNSFHLKNATYILGNDIVIPAGVWDPFSNQTAVGARGPFSGVLDGAGHTISFVRAAHEAPIAEHLVNDGHATVYRNGGNGWGIVGVSAPGAIFRNLTIYVPEEVTLDATTGGNAGVLLGDGASLTNIENVHVHGGGTLTAAGGSNIGGMVGITRLGSNTRMSSTSINVFAPNSSNVGGLTGYLFDVQSVSRVFAHGDVTGFDRVGGLMGFNEQTTITLSHATGNVMGRNDVGGFAGRGTGASFNINQSFSTGDVFGVDRVGGFIGATASSGSMVRNYALGSVSGVNNVGGFIGQLSITTFQNNASYGSVTLHAGTNNANVGGLIGIIQGNTTVGNLATPIDNNFAWGDITIESNNSAHTVNIGALVGRINSLWNTNNFVRSGHSANRNIVAGGFTANGVNLNVGTVAGIRDLTTQSGGTTLTGAGNMQVANWLRVDSSFGTQAFGSRINGAADLSAGAGLISHVTTTQLEIPAGWGGTVPTIYSGWTTANWVFSEGALNPFTDHAVFGNDFVHLNNLPVPNISEIFTWDGTFIPRDTHTIMTAEQLSQVGNGFGLATDNFVLGADITLTTGWIPTSTTFRGNFDGAGRTITIDGSIVGPVHMGIFQIASDAVFGNINVHFTDGSIIQGGSDVGAITGRATRSVFNDINVTGNGTVRTTMDDSGFGVGGIVGQTLTADVMNRITSTVNAISNNGLGANAGGLIGVARTTRITDSWASGRVEGRHAGGLLGWSTTGSVITRSVSFGDVVGQYTAGGINGATSWAITFNDVIAFGDITLASGGGSVGSGTRNSVGGIVGRVSQSSLSVNINRSYFYGNIHVTATSGYVSVGGLVGLISSAAHAVFGANINASVVYTHAITIAPGVNADVGAVVGTAMGNLTLTTGRTTSFNNEMTLNVGPMPVGPHGIALGARRNLAGWQPNVGPGVTIRPELMVGRTYAWLRAMTAPEFAGADMGWDFGNVWVARHNADGNPTNPWEAIYGSNALIPLEKQHLNGLPMFRMHWEIVRYSVTLLLNAGSATLPNGTNANILGHPSYHYLIDWEDRELAGTFSVNVTPTLGNWRFDGWFTAEVGGERLTCENGIFNSVLRSRIINAGRGQSIVMFPQWTATLEYRVLGSVHETRTIRHGVMEVFANIVPPNSGGWTFDGWFTNYAQAHDSPDALRRQQHTTFTVLEAPNSDGVIRIFARMTHAVTYHTHGGPAVFAGTRVFGTNFTPATPAVFASPNGNWNFAGWFLTASDALNVPANQRIQSISGTDISTAQFMNLHARWAGQVIYSSLGGVYHTQTFIRGVATDFRGTPTNAGVWTFEGWRYDSVDGTPIVAQIPANQANATISLFARMSRVVDLDYRGAISAGAVIDDIATHPVTVTVTFGMPTILPNPSAMGHSFDGWSRDASSLTLVPSTWTDATAPTTFTAFWTNIVDYTAFDGAVAQAWRLGITVPSLTDPYRQSYVDGRALALRNQIRDYVNGLILALPTRQEKDYTVVSFANHNNALAFVTAPSDPTLTQVTGMIDLWFSFLVMENALVNVVALRNAVEGFYTIDGMNLTYNVSNYLPNYVSARFTTNSWNIFDQSIRTALSLLNNGTQAQVNAHVIQNLQLVNVVALNVAIVAANVQLDRTDVVWTIASRNALQDALNAVSTQTLLVNGSQSAVDTATANIMSLTAALMQSLDISILQALINRVNTDYLPNQADFTPNSWASANLLALRDAAQDFVDSNPADNAANQEILTIRITNLTNAINSLLLRGDRAALQQAIATAQSMVLAPSGAFTQVSRQTLVDALAAAQAVDHDNSTASDIAQPYANLAMAIQNIVHTLDLHNLFVQVDAKDGNNYKPTLWTALTNVVEPARALLVDGAQEAVNAAVTEITQRLGELVPRANRTALGLLIANVNTNFPTTVQNNFTQQAWATLMELLGDAQTIYANLNATQTSIDAIYALLNAQRIAMPSFDIVALRAQIAIAEGLTLTNYSTVTRNAIADALYTAQGLVVNGTSLQIAGATTALQTTIANRINIVALRNAVNNANNFLQENHSVHTWDVLASAVSVANDLIQNATVQSTVDSQVIAVNNAITNLRPDVDALRELVEHIEEHLFWSLFMNWRSSVNVTGTIDIDGLISSANILLSNLNNTVFQPVVNQMFKQVNNAYLQLVETPAPSDIMDRARSFNQQHFSAASWSAFGPLLDAAELALRNWELNPSRATYREFRDRVWRLIGAHSGLNVDKTALGQALAIIELEPINPRNYTSASVARYNAILNAAREKFEAPIWDINGELVFTQIDIDRAVLSLITIRDVLEPAEQSGLGVGFFIFLGGAILLSLIILLVLRIHNKRVKEKL